jgi:ATP-binding cassette subfamily B multidrug efflux pump
MFRGSQKRPLRLLEGSSFIRHYLWKYKVWVGIGLLALVVVDVLDILPAFLLKRVVDVVVERQPLKLLGFLALGYFGIAILQGICRYAWRMFLIRASVLAGRDLRSEYTRHLYGLSISFFDRQRLGDLMSLATNDIEAVRMAIGAGLLVFADALFFLLTVPIAMYLMSPKLTFLVCLPLPLVPWIVLRNEKEVHHRFLRVQDCFGKISALVQESLNGIRVIKAFSKEDTQLQRIREIGKEYCELNLNLARIQTTLGPKLDLCMSFGMFILLFFGGSEMISTGQGAITLGTFVAFQRYIQKMIWPMTALGMAANYFQRAHSSSNRLREILETQTDVPDPAQPLRPILWPGAQTGRIEFKALDFRFPGGEERVLEKINLVIEPGARIAIVGNIGAGKSALLSLLPRLYPVERGMLKIDGIDVNDWEVTDLRQRVGYVGQEVFLFSDSVLENVAFGLPDWRANQGAVSLIEEAAQVASIHEEIGQFTHAYRTRLGERGLNLSGGQKQRLTLARAVAKQPSILILDDALSSVDIQTEGRILKALRDRPGKNTELIAAHRISTIQDADRILVLQNGQIVQDGTHAQLIRARTGLYWKVYEQQKLKEDLEAYENELSPSNGL